MPELTAAAWAIIFGGVTLIIAGITLVIVLPGIIRDAQARRLSSRTYVIPEFVSHITAPTAAKTPEPPKVEPKPEAPIQPAPAPVATDAAQRTVAAVAALPSGVLWDREIVKAASMPLMQGADGWHALSILDSQHTVVCGASNSGKGNVLRLMAVSVLSLGPDVAHLWVFDTKSGVDYPLCTRIEHARLYANVKYADGIEKDGKSESKIDYGLKLAKAEMDRRNDLMFGKATNIHTYNKKVEPAERLPIIVLILDEFADFNAEQKELTETLVRQGRSAGFVVFLATQYPTAAVLSSQIQANCLRRICLRVDSAKRTLVSLGLEPGEARPFEPSAIASSGVAVYKTSGGTMHIGRVPYITDELYDVLSDEYAERWPRVATESGEDEAIADEKNSSNKWEASIRELAQSTELSSNKIYEQVGGNRNEVLRIVREERGNVSHFA